MKKLFTLGDLYVSDFIRNNEEPRGGKMPLELVIDESIGAVRLKDPTDPSLLYGKYWYRSGINATMTNELKEIAEEAISCIPVNEGDVFLDIACNDGTLLKFVPNDMVKVGVDPVDDSYYKESAQIADVIIQDYFSKKAYKDALGDKKAKIITVIAMFYDLDDPFSFLRQVMSVMEDDGLLIVQMSYTPLMLKQLAFDNICHEHVYYYSLTSIKKLFNLVGLDIVDCKLNDINGGSFRVFARKNNANVFDFKTAPYRDVANYRIDSFLKYEEDMKITESDPYIEFFEKVTYLKESMVGYIRHLKYLGKSIWCYGASTKGNTLLQWFGLDNTVIDGIAERSPHKFGLKTVGTNIPIFSEAEMRKVNPDFMIVLPWHFINEFCEREIEYLKSGGKFIVPCPKLEIIAYDNVSEKLVRL